jgi:DNA-binding protein HU-beta
MNKSELVNRLVAFAKCKKSEAENMLQAVLSVFTDALVAGDNIALIGFGTLKPSSRKERKGINPQTGKSIVIPASKTVTFKAGKALKDAVNKKGKKK